MRDRPRRRRNPRPRRCRPQCVLRPRPVLIFAGLSPYTIEGEYRGSRTEYIHWIQDVPDQKQIVSQYCRYTGEIKAGRNVKQMVNRALSFARSQPSGPVYLYGAREPMEEDIEPYALEQEYWNPVAPAALPRVGVLSIATALVEAKEALLITGYSGRNHDCPKSLVRLADAVPGLRVLDTGGSDMCFPAGHAAWLGLRYGVEDSIKTADAILVLDCDVPWINTQCRPKPDAKIYHVDVDPLKQQMPVFYLNALARYRADAKIAVDQITDHIKHDQSLQQHLSGTSGQRASAMRKAYQSRKDKIRALAVPSQDDSFATSYLISRLRHHCPKDTIWCIEAVTQSAFVADQIQAELPGSWINCGGGGLGWSGGGALGIKLATMKEETPRFVCQIVGDGTFLFSVPGSVYWIAQRYKIPVLTIVLNNQGWNAPKRSLLLVHPDGPASKVTNEELNISFAPSPDYAGIAKAAAGGRAWTGATARASELDALLQEAIKSVEGGTLAVLDAHLEGPEGKFGGGKSALVG